MRTRAEHLQWCKDRALEYADAGDGQNAIASMVSDLGKHPETASSVDIAARLDVGLRLGGHLQTPAQIREWVEGFN